MTSAWGGYVFIINMIALHVFVLILSKLGLEIRIGLIFLFIVKKIRTNFKPYLQQYCEKLYVSYTTFYLLGQLMAMNIPFVGFQPVETSEHMAGFGVFGLIQLAAVHGRIAQVYLFNFSLRQRKLDLVSNIKRILTPWFPPSHWWRAYQFESRLREF